VKNIFSLLFFLLVLSGCSVSPDSYEAENEGDLIQLKYATGLTLREGDNHYIVEILTPYKGATSSQKYVLYQRGSEIPDVEADAFIQVPVTSMVCTSTTHIPLLDYLGESDALVGFPTLDYISSATMREKIDRGELEELGVDDALNIENLIILNPEMVMGYTMSADFGQFNLIKEAGIPVVLNAEYLEQHPLGRAEWIKLTGLLFNKQKIADSVFRHIENQYLSTLELVRTSVDKPSVMSGIVYGDSWFMPGGKNYAAKMLQDAGFKYVWDDDTTKAFLPLSFETVFDRAHDSEYWIGVGSFKSLAELASADSRYKNFTPFSEQRIYSYNKRVGAKGGSEFLELGYLRPDLILKDLVKIAYPDLLPDHTLFFHFQLL
jgi:iron complex transport system substrate-binding protein